MPDASTHSYFKFFVSVLFPPAAVLLFLLMLPVPRQLQKHIVKMCDVLLFWRPHPHIPLSLFYCVLLLSFLTFAEMMLEVRAQ